MPKTDSAKLTPPKELSPGAKKEWKRVVKLYKTLEVPILCDLDIAVLSAYCIEVDIRNLLYKKWVETQKQAVIITDGTESTIGNFTATGTPKGGSRAESKRGIVNPILKEIERHNKTIRILAEQLALTPAGRAAYAVRQEKNNQTPAESFMDNE